MDLRRLENFVAVVDAGSIGRAALSLHVAQPALSRQMQLLEDEVGIALFERLPRGVRLTPGGQEFLNGVRRLLKDSVQVVENAVRASRGEFGALSLGVSEFYAFHPQVLAMIRGYTSQSPAVRFRLAPLLSGEIVQQITDGGLDGGFVFSVPWQTPALSSRALLKEKLLVAVSSTSALGRRKRCRLAMIDGTDLILVPREQTPWFYDFLIHLLHERGIVPRVTLEGGNHSAVMALVAAGLGYALVPATARFVRPPDVALLEIDDLDVEIGIDFVWRADNRSPSLARFVEFGWQRTDQRNTPS